MAGPSANDVSCWEAQRAARGTARALNDVSPWPPPSFPPPSSLLFSLPHNCLQAGDGNGCQRQWAYRSQRLLVTVQTFPLVGDSVGKRKRKGERERGGHMVTAGHWRAGHLRFHASLSARLTGRRLAGRRQPTIDFAPSLPPSLLRFSHPFSLQVYVTS